MEFPIEIQMLINDYARPLTRPDWRKGSSINRDYRSWGGQLGRLNIRDFKSYLKQCSIIDEDENYEAWAYFFERRDLDDISIVFMREEEYKNRHYS